ncbi:MAG: transposase [Pseudomonadota bacterium]
MTSREIEPYIAGPKRRKEHIEYDDDRYPARKLVERVFAKLKDWRRVATRHDRCAHTVLPAICIAATVLFRL